MQKNLRAVLSLLGVSTALASGHAFAQQAPYIQIQSISSVNGGCSTPGVSVSVIAYGNASHSDNFTIGANGAVHFTWTGETMGWASNNGSPQGYGINASSTAVAANTIMSGVITAYEGAAPTGNPTTGQRAVYRSTVQWNCTTGAQVGQVLNEDLRASVVPTMSTGGLLGLSALIGLAAVAVRRRRWVA
ncbi:MAG: IPTL-CTERM sorting domain-containing protein [Burkholderiales bacterium]|nr:IPTL-CTERM sorting domain-containing protein [Burkholderiales bacterium]